MKEQLTVNLGKFIARHLRGGKLGGHGRQLFNSIRNFDQPYCPAPLSDSMQELPASSTYHLETTITRPDVVDWLQSLPPEKLGGEVERTLAAGNLVLTMIQASTGEEAMSRFFGPIVDRMKELDGTLKEMQGKVNKSQRIGELGESLVAKQLKDAFPEDEFELTAKDGHQADIRAKFKVTSGKQCEALVEVKLYANDVPKAELEKFRNDLGQTRRKYGLMVSLSSRLTGIHGPIHLEETEEYLAIYVPNAGIDGWGVRWGAALLKSIIAYRERAAERVIPTGAIEHAWRKIQHELLSLEKVTSELQSIKAEVIEARTAVLIPLDRLLQRAVAADLLLSDAMGRIQNRLGEELMLLPQTGILPEYVKGSPPDQILGEIAKMREDKDKRHETLMHLYTSAQEAGIDIALTETLGGWRFLKEGHEIGFTKAQKGRVDLTVLLHPEKPVTFVPGLDEIKGNEVTVKGDKPEKLAERARFWFATVSRSLGA